LGVILTVSSTASPRIAILGTYVPCPDAPEYESLVLREIASRDPATFDEGKRKFLKRMGRTNELLPLTEQRAAAIRSEVDEVLSEAVLLEILVVGADKRFKMGEFVQPNPSKPERCWQCAWHERFLTIDGRRLIPVPWLKDRPDVSDFRVTFYIHYWLDGEPLNSSYGPLFVTTISPMPPRLWRLNPYTVVD
jgi:hypothetical protein